MPVYPGTASPLFQRVATLDEQGFEEHLLTLLTHTGTHIDAPAHTLSGGASIDQIPVDHFIGPGCVVDVAGPSITLATLKAHEAQIEGADFVILRSGWWRRWGRADYFEGFPVLTDAAADWLSARGLKGVGVDMISVDAVGSPNLLNHHALLSAGVLLIENLTQLDALPLDGFELICLPLQLKGGDGSPVRAVARLL
ncbi:cyclase family protein [Myxococcota bacterium]|nr:cyclase family protein [Myxococcota bacterium]MBU1896686.1 cyclase family protein [Myxococcota bacterium]